MDKILFVSDVPIKTPNSGSEQVINNQAVRLCEGGLDVFAITRQNGKMKYVKSRNVMGIKESCYFADTENLFSFFFSLFKKPVKIFNHLPINDPFIIAICHQPFTYFALLARGKLRNAPSIYVFHSPNHEEYLTSQKDKNFIKRFAQTLVRRLIERYCLRHSQKIVVLSEYMRNRVIKTHKIKHELITVNPGGVDLDRFIPPRNRTNLKEAIGLPACRLNFLTVRNLEPRMGLDNLLKAVALLKEKEVDLHLVIGGEGPEGKNLEDLIKREGLENDVSMAGFIPADQLPKYYGAADFFILPTRHLEGFGLVTIESLACGTPVLGTPVGGTKEILANLNPDLLFKDSSPESMAEGIQSAIKKIYQDKNNYDQLRQSCREYTIANYSWQRHIAQLKSVIDDLSSKKDITN